MFGRVYPSTYQKPEVFLAVFRMLLGMVFLGSYELHNIDVYIPLDAPAYTVMVFASYLIYVCAVFVIIGFIANFSWFVIVCSSGYMMYWIQFYNHTIHMHHLWWFAVILCFATVGKWSMNSIWDKKKHAVFSVGAHHSVLGVITIFASVFLFPGVHKILSTNWISGDTLRQTIAWKQTQYWDASWYCNNLFPHIEYFSVVAMGVALWELSLVYLLWSGKYRWFVFFASVFHGCVWVATDISFVNLWILYPSLLFLPEIPMTKLWNLVREVEHNKLTEQPHFSIPKFQAKFVSSFLCRWIPSTVYSVLILGILYAGITKKQSGFPWVCYPTFTQPISKYMPLLAIQIVDATEQKYLLDYRIFIQPNDQAWRTNWKLAGLGYPIQPGELQRYFQESVGVQNYLETHPEIMPPHTIEFYYAHIDTTCTTQPCTNQDSPIRLLRILHTYTRK